MSQSVELCWKVWNQLIILTIGIYLTSSRGIVFHVQLHEVVCENAKNSGLKYKELPHSVSEYISMILLLRAIQEGTCFSAPPLMLLSMLVKHCRTSIRVCSPIEKLWIQTQFLCEWKYICFRTNGGWCPLLRLWGHAPGCCCALM